MRTAVRNSHFMVINTFTPRAYHYYLPVFAQMISRPLTILLGFFLTVAKVMIIVAQKPN